jgi:hypothetical protein
LTWAIWWDTERRTEVARWNVASAQTEAGALDRAQHFLRLGCVVHAIRDPDGAIYMDEAQISTRFGAKKRPTNDRW